MASWQTLVARKRQQCADNIPPEWRLPDALLQSLNLSSPTGERLIAADIPRRSGLLSDSELDVTENYTATQLVGKLAAGELSSLEVTTAFCKRAAIAQQLVCSYSVYLCNHSVGPSPRIDEG